MQEPPSHAKVGNQYVLVGVRPKVVNRADRLRQCIEKRLLPNEFDIVYPVLRPQAVSQSRNKHISGSARVAALKPETHTQRSLRKNTKREVLALQHFSLWSNHFDCPGQPSLNLALHGL